MKKKTHDNIVMRRVTRKGGNETYSVKSHEKESFINKEINTHVVKYILVRFFKNKGIKKEKAEELANNLLINPLFINAVDKLQEKSKTRIVTDMIAAIKDIVAEIPVFGGLADLAIDFISKWAPQTYYTYKELNDLEDIIEKFNIKPSTAAPAAHAAHAAGGYRKSRRYRKSRKVKKSRRYKRR